MAKNKSKRVSERRKTRNVQRNTRNEAKIRREQKKKMKGSVKIPKSVLMTEEEKEHLKNIKASTEIRSREANVKKPDVPQYLLDLEKCIFKHNCDAFIEVLDFHDIEGSRDKAAENFLKQNSKNFYVFINNNNGMFDIDLSYLDNEGIALLRDFSTLSNFNKLCIFGNQKTGKFLLSKTIEDYFGDDAGKGSCNNAEAKNKEFEFVRTPSNRLVISSVLGGALNLDDIKPVFMFEKIWEFVDKEELKMFYSLRSFSDYETFLSLLYDKIEDKNSAKKDLNKAALYFFRDVLSKKIGWIRHQNRLYFKFDQIQ